MTLGLVCDACDALSPLNATVCQVCGASLGVNRAPTAPGSHLRPGKTMFFGAMQAPSPKLILIKGEGMDGVTYVLSSSEHIAGRLEGAILFPEDPLLSPRHANFLYKD